MNDINWDKIREEYIADESTSYRKLAAKYGVKDYVIYRRGHAEGWPALRKQCVDETIAKAVEKISQNRANKLDSVMDAADQLIQKVMDAIKELDKKTVRKITKTKKVEYGNASCPDKPTGETITETEEYDTIDALLDRQGIKALTSALRDLKEVLSEPTDLDKREQAARIANLEKQVNKGDDDNVHEVVVTFAAGDEDWNE